MNQFSLHIKTEGDWSKTIKSLENGFRANITTFGLDPILLKQGETIIDKYAFVNSHMTICKANKGNETFKPYLDRLILFANKLQAQKAEVIEAEIEPETIDIEKVEKVPQMEEKPAKTTKQLSLYD